MARPAGGKRNALENALEREMSPMVKKRIIKKGLEKQNCSFCFSSPSFILELIDDSSDC